MPERCLACGGPALNGFCAECFHDLPWNDHACQQCAAALTGPLAGLCGECLRRRPSFDAAYAAFLYAWPIDRLLLEFKYHGRLATGRSLAQSLLEYLEMKAAPHPDILTPVPLYRRRLARRGFNQAAELARTIAGRLNVAYAPRLLRRVRETPSQSGLGAEERSRNVRGAFECKRSLVGLNVGLVDDVVTTGSTAGAAARALHESGAASITVYAVARA